MTGRPLFTECVVGFRYWSLRGDDLFPITRGAAWVPGVNEAVCHAATPPEHSAPHNGCDCGLYALHAVGPRPRRSRPGEKLVLGATASWGDIEVHRTGIRAQFAQIVALARLRGRDAQNIVFPEGCVIVAGTFEQAAEFLGEHDADATDATAPRLVVPTALHPPALIAQETILLPGWDRDPRFAAIVRDKLDAEPGACLTVESLHPSLERAALHYRVPLVELEDLADVASAFGEALPESAWPDEESPLSVAARDLPIHVLPPPPAPIEPRLTPDAEAELIAHARPPFDTLMRRRRNRVRALLSRAATPEGEDAELIAFLAARDALPIDNREQWLRARQRLHGIGATADPPPGVRVVARRHGVEPGDGDAFVQALIPHRRDFIDRPDTGTGVFSGT